MRPRIETPRRTDLCPGAGPPFRTWRTWPLTITVVLVSGVALFGLGSQIDIGLVLPFVVIGACFWWLARVADLPQGHAAAGALVFGETLWVVTATLLQHGPSALLPHAIDIAVPTLLLVSFLAGRFALAERAALPLWLLLMWEAYGLYRGFAFAASQPTLVIFLKIAIRFAATLTLAFIAFGWEAPGSLSRSEDVVRRG